MNDAPEVTPDDEPVEVEVERPKTGAEAWKERRALIISRGAAARDRSQGVNNDDKATNRVAEQRKLNTEREASQLRAKNTGRTQKRARG
jgi:hypothetical protein